MHAIPAVRGWLYVSWIILPVVVVLVGVTVTDARDDTQKLGHRLVPGMQCCPKGADSRALERPAPPWGRSRR